MPHYEIRCTFLTDVKKRTIKMIRDLFIIFLKINLNKNNNILKTLIFENVIEKKMTIEYKFMIK